MRNDGKRWCGGEIERRMKRRMKRRGKEPRDTCSVKNAHKLSGMVRTTGSEKVCRQGILLSTALFHFFYKYRSPARGTSDGPVFPKKSDKQRILFSKSCVCPTDCPMFEMIFPLIVQSSKWSFLWLSVLQNHVSSDCPIFKIVFPLFVQFSKSDKQRIFLILSDRTIR